MAKHHWVATGFHGVGAGDFVNRPSRLSPPQNGDRSSAAASGDFRAIESILWSARAHKIDEQVGPLRAQPTCGIAGVGLIHQFSQLLELRFARALHQKLSE